jgi:hypothetical protein
VFSGAGEHVESAGARFRGLCEPDSVLRPIAAIAWNLP